MNAPMIWIVFPIAVGVLLLPINNQRALSVLGGLIALLLAVVAQLVPIELAMNLGSISIKINFLLHSFGTHTPAPPRGGSTACVDLWCCGALVFRRRGIQDCDAARPDGIMITALLVASLAVEPFLYAALFIEMAILLAIPMLTTIYHPPSKGVCRFLIYQTLAMPFILLAGWLLAVWNESRRPGACRGICVHAGTGVRFPSGDLSTV